MTKSLVIFGASNFGDEVAQVFSDINRVTPTWRILGFLDDDPSKWGTFRNTLPVLGGREWLNGKSTDINLFVAVGNPPARKRLAAALAEHHELTFATGIHPTVISSPSNKFGAGTIVMAGTILTTNIAVGNHVIINPGCTIGHNTMVADFCTINPRAAVAGDIDVEEGVYIGIGATIINKLRLGRGAIIGAGAVVIGDLTQFSTSVGVPARAIKNRTDDLNIGEEL